MSTPSSTNTQPAIGIVTAATTSADDGGAADVVVGR